MQVLITCIFCFTAGFVNMISVGLLLFGMEAHNWFMVVGGALLIGGTLVLSSRLTPQHCDHRNEVRSHHICV